jgi:hypothetical protein
MKFGGQYQSLYNIQNATWNAQFGQKIYLWAKGITLMTLLKNESKCIWGYLFILVLIRWVAFEVHFFFSNEPFWLAHHKMIFEALQQNKKSLYYSQDKNVKCLPTYLCEKRTILGKHMG